ncbi:MAG TPA: class I SAM-dependent methyltransferase [Anaerolineales bacterium]|nr:class I SAM-dependent methyltransferase [Anaerolineales bacterium]HRQ92239.1 class I SAM-dependent methyltransferase [Anaerolineales bacterium]
MNAQTKLSPACKACGSQARYIFSSTDKNRRLSKQVFDYFCCNFCGVIFIDPIPLDLSVYYANGYYLLPQSVEKLDALANGLIYQLDMVRQFNPKGKLLEIGPAYGAFARLAKLYGYEVETIEMDEKCCDYLENVAGVGVVRSDKPEQVLPSLEKKDVIVMWHVIEHLPDPWEVLVKAVETLLPEGLLAIASPNPSAFQFRILRSYWPHLDAPRHLQLIPADLLISRLEPLGLEPILLTSTDAGGRSWNVFGWRKTLQNFFPAPSLQLPMRALGSLISLAMYPLENFHLNGSTYSIVFRKKKV